MKFKNNVQVKIVNKTSGAVIHNMDGAKYLYKYIPNKPISSVRTIFSRTSCGIGFYKEIHKDDASKNVLKIKYGNLPFRELKTENFQKIYSQKKLISMIEKGCKLCPKCFPLERIDINEENER